MLRPGGYTFFRESHFRPAGSRPHAVNPTVYRTMKVTDSHMITSHMIPLPSNITNTSAKLVILIQIMTRIFLILFSLETVKHIFI